METDLLGIPVSATGASAHGGAHQEGDIIDEWGNLSAMARASTARTMRRLGEEEAAADFSWERLSNVTRETEGQVFHGEEFTAHLERVAASEDNLPDEPRT